ncbi:MAG: dTDP-4-dehydrorhamnose 3,5-epimerase [Candidatus Levybacteria bacterium RBG_16_35_11]|nr:MAG: dTDP-4-dehydrorhamnose 3,5-epimerase [Candidatus Levybacteria bacterium RBG_16_35_11]
MPFKFSCLEIPDVILVEPKIFGDKRGLFMEIYKYSDFLQAGIREYFVQDNYSESARNVLRGLHYQKHPKTQGKLVRCVKGRIFDVAVDIRVGSPTYSRWVGHELSEDNKLMLYIPPAFAHGFVVLSDSSEVMYKCTKEYSPENDRGIIWNDPDIGIKWPVDNPILSDDDRRHPLLKYADNNFRYGFTL